MKHKRINNSFKKYYLSLFLILMINVVAVFAFTPVFADECGGVDTTLISCEEGGDGGIWHTLNLIVDIMSVGVGILGLIGVIMVGMHYLTAGPNVEKAAMAKKRFYEIFIGLAAYAMMFTVLQWLLPNGVFKNMAVGIEEIKVVETDVKVEVGKTQKLSVDFEPSDAADKTLTWKSSNPDVAVVRGNGVVVGKKVGNAKITATSANGKKAKTKIEVRPDQLDFSYKGNGTVKSQFSSDTLKIVEDHLYDVDAENFYSVIKSKGGFAKYAKSLGGVFGDYYGKTITGRRTYDFQRAAEYVLGWMYMYGWDYINGGGDHMPWGGDHYTPDAFYYRGTLQPSTHEYSGFDDMINGQYGLSMASECGGLPWFVYGKMGLEPEENQFITRFKDLRPGDVIYFKDYIFNKAGRDETWYRKPQSMHNAMIGEVYDDRIVIYDVGRHFQSTQNFKRTLRIPETEEEEYEEIRREFGSFVGWAAVRTIDWED